MTIVVASDTHLGYDQSDHDKFERFLDDILQREDVTNFVMLGDFIDMWRRDVSGIFLEFNSIVQKIVTLSDRKKVHCVIGNHDYHLWRLSDQNNHFRNEYPLNFEKDTLCITEDGVTYRFRHGHQFDPMQNEVLMELLCHTMSDDVGDLRSDFWSWIKSLESEFKTLRDFFKLHKNNQSYYENMLSNLQNKGSGSFEHVENLIKPPKERGLDFNLVEKNALDDLHKNPSTKLIFGHTHVPFVTPDNNMANSGSWLKNETPYNTYVEIDEKGIHLMQDKKDITKKFTRPASSYGSGDSFGS